MTTTILRSHFGILLHKCPLNNNHLSATVTVLGPKGGRFTITGLTGIEDFLYSIYFKIVPRKKKILKEKRKNVLLNLVATMAESRT